MFQRNLYLETNKLFPLLQSAYLKHHSTETALLRVLDGILMSIDHREDVVLVMLDLSAAFDTLDHEILISRLGSYFGFSDTVLRWFSSYLSGRTQSVIIGKTASNPHPVDLVFPKGQSLEPVLFTLYVAPLQDIVAAYNTTIELSDKVRDLGVILDKELNLRLWRTVCFKINYIYRLAHS